MGLPPLAGGKLLEIGCGSGERLALLKKLGWDVQGLELDPAAVQVARRRNLPVAQGTVEEQRFAGSSFDAVVSNHVLEHVSAPEALLRESWRILRPNGFLVAYTPNAESLGCHLFGSKWRGLELPRHLQVYSCGGLRRLCTACGFSVEKCSSSGRGGAILAKSLKMFLGYRGQRGVEDMGPTSKLVSELLGLVEAGLAGLGTQLGEEIVLVARKAAASNGHHELNPK